MIRDLRNSLKRERLLTNIIYQQDIQIAIPPPAVPYKTYTRADVEQAINLVEKILNVIGEVIK